MAYTDEEKLRIVVEEITQRFEKVQTWTELKTLISAITPTKVKNFVKNALQEQSTSEDFHVTLFTERKANTDLLENEIENI